MADTENKYLANRLKFHTASRVAISTAYSLMQSMNPDGHIVTKQQVWTADIAQFPKNTGANRTTSNGVDATNDLVNVFTNNLTEGNGVVKTTLSGGGEVWTNTAYPAVKLYRNAVLSAVNNSDNMAYELLVDGSRVMDWVAPTSVKDDGLPIPGYTGIVEGNSGGSWTVIQTIPDNTYGWELAKGNWEFVYMSGMVTFHPDYIPSKMGCTGLRITAFAYAGDYLADTLSSMQQNTANNMLAVKPFTFSEAGMAIDGQTGDATITVPGLVFNVFCNETGLAYGDLTYNANGTTLVTFEDFDEANFNVDNEANFTPTFTAYAFVLGDESPITIKPVESLDNP